VNIIAAIDDPKVFGPHFQGETWASCRAFLAALFGLPLTPEQLAIYRQCTGRSEAPTPVSEAWLVCGRRSGKSFTLALIAVFLSAFRDWRPHLGPGERGTVMVIAADRKQARTIMRYVKGLLSSIPMLARTVQAERAESIDLQNRITIEVHTASFRTVRGYTIVAALLDEIAFWPSEDSANPDTEIIAALRPAMATVPGAMLLCASSPYARRGALWTSHDRHYGKEGDPVLVWQAPTRTMNPTVPQSVIDEALAEDESHARAEYLAEFRTDVEAFLTREAVLAVVSRGVRERLPLPEQRYFAFTDPSGGAHDSFTLAIAHRENDKVVLDALRETKPPFSPEGVVAEFATTLRSYRISTVTGDRYAGDWPREQFRKRCIAYQPAPKPKSDLYLELLAPINSGTCSLLDNERCINQLVGLERRTARSGRDSIDHAPGARDDVANALAGAIHLVLSEAARQPEFVPGPLPCAQIIRAGDGASRFGPKRVEDYVLEPPWLHLDDGDEANLEKENAKC
jgi:hypothetical protein